MVWNSNRKRHIQFFPKNLNLLQFHLSFFRTRSHFFQMMDASLSSLWSETPEFVFLVLDNLAFPWYQSGRLAKVKVRVIWVQMQAAFSPDSGICVIGSAGSVAMLSSRVTVYLAYSSGNRGPIEMPELFTQQRRSKLAASVTGASQQQIPFCGTSANPAYTPVVGLRW